MSSRQAQQGQQQGQQQHGQQHHRPHRQQQPQKQQSLSPLTLIFIRGFILPSFGSAPEPRIAFGFFPAGGVALSCCSEEPGLPQLGGLPTSVPAGEPPSALSALGDAAPRPAPAPAAPAPAGAAGSAGRGEARDMTLCISSMLIRSSLVIIGDCGG